MQKVTDNIYLLVIVAMIGTALLAMSFILFVIYNSNKLLKQKRMLQEAEINYQKELLYAVIDSQEKERQRIGMDLHDEVGSSLSSLRLMLENFTNRMMGISEADLFFIQSKSVIDSLMTSVRNISHDLSPFGTGRYDFADALEDLQSRVNQSGKIQMTLHNHATDLGQLNKMKSLALYRVFSELINNTIKHAQAKKIALLITQNNNTFEFNYKDNGTGIKQVADGMKTGMGMRNVESRLRMIGSDFTFNKTEDGGFEITIVLKSL
jgi:signal transduction histidine kinase